MALNEPTLVQSFGAIFIISLVVTIISNYVENLSPFHKTKCGDGMCPSYNILFVRFVHYFINFILILYVFFFSKKYDVYYIILYSIIVIHWIVLNDCYLSNLEISLYNDKHDKHDSTEIRTNTLLHPHYRVFVGDNTDYIVLIQILVMTSIFLIILNRMDNKYFKILF